MALPHSGHAQDDIEAFRVVQMRKARLNGGDGILDKLQMCVFGRCLAEGALVHVD